MYKYIVKHYKNYYNKFIIHNSDYIFDNFST